jgi:hypothetical protein
MHDLHKRNATSGASAKPADSKFKFLYRVHADTRLSSSVKCAITMLVLHFHNKRTGQCNPGLDAIAKAIGRKPRVTAKIIAELKQSGWVDVGTSKGGSHRNTNRYRFDFSTGAQECTPGVHKQVTTGALECQRHAA